MTGAHGFIMTTTPSKDDAARIARLLIDEKLAACVQLLAIESFYSWQGATQNAPETLMLIKTRTALFERAIARIKQVHPYTVPEIVGTPFTAGLASYLNWIDEVTE
ncbi:MAG TPA: divalent-cation tolerance protein CutA [Rhizomicrobium sp.]|jgi:periplasmic divalent cation tolerance protein|nr:divalent-cation tolerance protein CutA [Rhizomicrobium sp.]